MIYTRPMTADDMLMCGKCGTAIVTTQEKIEALYRTKLLLECPAGGLHVMGKYSPVVTI